MATFTPEQFRLIIQKLIEKIGSDRACPMCGHNSWLVNDGVVLLPLQPAGAAFMIGGKSLPTVTMTCTTCGNTVLFNAFTLGVADLLGLVPMPPEGSK